MSEIEMLVQQCVEGDKRAQRVLYDRFSGKVYGICMRYTPCKEEANDYFQEVFIRIFKNLSSLREAQALEKWISRVAVTTILNVIKAKGNVRFEDVDEIEDGPSVAPSTEMEERELLTLISQLPENYRVVFNMFAIEGFSHAEIAEKLGINESTSRSNLSRARIWLMSKLEKRKEHVQF